MGIYLDLLAPADRCILFCVSVLGRRLAVPGHARACRFDDEYGRQADAIEYLAVACSAPVVNSCFGRIPLAYLVVDRIDHILLISAIDSYAGAPRDLCRVPGNRATVRQSSIRARESSSGRRSRNGIGVDRLPDHFGPAIRRVGMAVLRRRDFSGGIRHTTVGICGRDDDLCGPHLRMGGTAPAR